MSAPIPYGDDLLIGQDNGVELDRLHDKQAAVLAYDLGATVTCALLTNYRNLGGSELISVAMQIVPGSKGKYQGTIPKTLALTDGVAYLEEMKAVLSNGKIGTWETWRFARRRVAQ